MVSGNVGQVGVNGGVELAKADGDGIVNSLVDIQGGIPQNKKANYEEGEKAKRFEHKLSMLEEGRGVKLFKLDGVEVGGGVGGELDEGD